INKRKSQLFKIIDNPGLFISTITLYELFAGAINEEKRKDIYDFIALVKILPFTSETAERAGEIYLSLRGQNELIDVRDILIGATALVHNLPIITLNVNHFARIKELEVL
ncbi:type II toxin-antitoxin system VapC family toxin, partial [Acidobacteriota bacterium]